MAEVLPTTARADGLWIPTWPSGEHMPLFTQFAPQLGQSGAQATTTAILQVLAAVRDGQPLAR